MSDPTNFRQERIEKLLHELRSEVERGILEHDIDETLMGPPAKPHPSTCF